MTRTAVESKPTKSTTAGTPAAAASSATAVAVTAPVAALPAPASATTHFTGGPVRPTPWWVWVLVVVGIAAVVGLIFLLVHKAKLRSETENEKKRGQHDMPVTVDYARKGDLNLYLSGLGTVTPFSTVTVKSRIDGAIIKVAFKEGQTVTANQVLFQIDPSPYLAALHQAQGQLAKDTAASINADQVVKRDANAIETMKGSLAQSAIDADQAAADEAKAAVEADKAAIEAAQVNVNYCTIRSPIDGRIGFHDVDLGNIVHASDTTALAVITQLHPITVVFDLPEDDLDRLQKRTATGEPVPVIAYDRDMQNQIATGTLLAIDSQIDSGSGTVKVKAEFDNKDGALFPNQFVNARLLVETEHAATLVPSAAVQPGTSGTYVYVVGGDDMVHIRNVKTGQSQAAVGPEEQDLTAIETGLSPGDTVVVDGVDKLTDGMKVVPKPAADTTGGTTRPTTRSTTRPVGGTTMPAGAGGRRHRG